MKKAMLIVALWLTFPPHIFAGELGEKAASSLEALEKANAYSFKNAGIGILIAFGNGNGTGVTPSIIGDQFVREFKRRGIESRYFFYVANWEGMTMEYHIGYSALGPWSVKEAASNVRSAVDRAEAMKEVHGHNQLERNGS